MLWRTLSAALEITKPEAPLDAVSFLRQLPVWGGCMKELSLLAREVEVFPRDRECRFCKQELRSCYLPLVSTVARTKAGKLESDVAISASQAIEGTVITAAAAPGWISLGQSRVRHPYGAGAVRFNHLRRDLVRSIGVCPASPPTP